MEYVIVKFNSRREILVDGNSQGYTADESGNQNVIQLEEGTFDFSLEGEKNFSPLSQEIYVSETNQFEPLEIVFTLND